MNNTQFAEGLLRRYATTRLTGEAQAQFINTIQSIFGDDMASARTSLQDHLVAVAQIKAGYLVFWDEGGDTMAGIVDTVRSNDFLVFPFDTAATKFQKITLPKSLAVMGGDIAALKAPRPVNDIDIRLAIWTETRRRLNQWNVQNDPRLSLLVLFGNYSSNAAFMQLINRNQPELGQFLDEFGNPVPIIKTFWERREKTNPRINLPNSTIWARRFEAQPGSLNLMDNTNYVANLTVNNSSTTWPTTGSLINGNNGIIQANRQYNANLPAAHAVTCADGCIYVDFHITRLVRDILESDRYNEARNIFAVTNLYSAAHIAAVWDFIFLVMCHELCHWGRSNIGNQAQNNVGSIYTQQQINTFFNQGADLIQIGALYPNQFPIRTFDNIGNITNGISDGTVPIGIFDITRNIANNNNVIEHGISWEAACYDRVVGYSTIPSVPNPNINSPIGGNRGSLLSTSPNVYAQYISPLLIVQDSQQPIIKQLINQNFVDIAGNPYYILPNPNDVDNLQLPRVAGQTIIPNPPRPLQ